MEQVKPSGEDSPPQQKDVEPPPKKARNTTQGLSQHKPADGSQICSVASCSNILPAGSGQSKKAEILEDYDQIIMAAELVGTSNFMDSPDHINSMMICMLEKLTSLFSFKNAGDDNWDPSTYAIFLLLCLKLKDKVLLPSGKLSFEAVATNMNNIIPKVDTSVEQYREKFWDFVIAYEDLQEQIEVFEVEDHELLPLANFRTFRTLCQAISCKSVPSLTAKAAEQRKNHSISSVFQFLNESLKEVVEMPADICEDTENEYKAWIVEILANFTVLNSYVNATMGDIVTAAVNFVKAVHK